MTIGAASAQPKLLPPLPQKAPTAKVISPEEQAKQAEIFKALRLARQAESDNDWAKALELWRFVDERRPGDFSAYSGIRRCLISLSRFDEALQFVDRAERLAKGGKSGVDLSSVGADRVEILFAARREDDADAEIERLIAANKGYSNLYRSLSNVLYAQRRSEEAIALLKRGRRESGDRFLFAREIAQFAEARMDWKTAVDEYLLYLAEAPDRNGYVAGVFGDILLEDGGEPLVFEAITAAERAVGAASPAIYLELRADLLMRTRRFVEALAAYRRLDSLGGENGAAMLDFAGRLIEEGELDLALAAFDETLARSAGGETRYRALLGKARALLAAGRLDSAKAAYRAVLTPGTRLDLAVEANYRLGLIAVKGGLPFEARTYFESAAKLIRETPSSAGNLAEAVQIQLAVTYEITGDLDRAKQELERVVKASAVRGAAAADARLELTRLAFRRGDVEAVKREANALLAGDASSAAANDALALLALLAGMSESPAEYQLLGRADHFALTGKKREAIALLDSLTRSGSTPRVVEEALWAKFALAEDAGDRPGALAILDRIESLGAAAGKRDRALFEAGRLLTDSGDADRALKAFDRLLTEYPDSPFGDNARRFARRLRNEKS